MNFGCKVGGHKCVYEQIEAEAEGAKANMRQVWFEPKVAYHNTCHLNSVSLFFVKVQVNIVIFIPKCRMTFNIKKKSKS